ncbi:TPA: hypothetical protein JJI53_18820 [Vibrio vulnificus]|nr:hypothetical protein [Vibrio vulnificus]HAS8443333.1 hypothetical protein [Vibrio vulnificus]HAV6900572.1 hypothetical protein [Vibrio vulnificus]
MSVWAIEVIGDIDFRKESNWWIIMAMKSFCPSETIIGGWLSAFFFMACKNTTGVRQHNLILPYSFA